MEAAREYPCAQCGATLEFRPGTGSLTCSYCGHVNEIETDDTAVTEDDFEETLAQLEAQASHDETADVIEVKCTSCGAGTTLDPNVSSADCPFCGTPIVATGASRRLLKPKYLLPFKITRRTASESFNAWLRKLWFAPSELKRKRRHEGAMQGLYVPYWTFDCHATTPYRGERGTHYYVTQTYTTQVNGKTVTKTRQVRKTRWRSVSGTVQNMFDDVLVRAGSALPHAMAEELEPWDLHSLVSFNTDYLSGFRAETYTTGLRDGFTFANGKMTPVIQDTIRRDIGGDEQRIHKMHPQYRDVSYKHILLPIWMSSYQYKGKSYRFLVNGRTGEVQGDRPYSWVKIASAVTAVLLIVGGAIAGGYFAGWFD